MLDALWQDSCYAIRALRNSPGFAAVTVLSLALGIGANTAIFSLIDAVMLKTLPVSHPEELLQVTMATPQLSSNPHTDGAGGRADSRSDDTFSRSDSASRSWCFCRVPAGAPGLTPGPYECT